MYWSVEVEDGIDETEDAEEGESESGDRIGEGAQWTVFLCAGVSAMRVDRITQTKARRDERTNKSRGRVRSIR
jgi:hypothetical protein